MLPGLAPSVAYPLPTMNMGGYLFDGTTQTTYTWTGIAIADPPAEGRRVFALVIGDQNSASRAFSSGTINGIAAVGHVLASSNTPGATEMVIMSAIVPTGTTATVVCTFTAACDRAACQIASSVGLKNSVPTGTLVGTPGLAPTGSLTDAEDGIAFGMVSNRGIAGPSTTWTGLTEYSDFTWDTVGSSKTLSIANLARVPQGETSRTVTGTTASGTARMIALSWR
jgi:hypothetical protein